MAIPVPESTARRADRHPTLGVEEVPGGRPGASPRNARTREAILTAALSLYAAEGYGAVTMRAIANRLGFSAPAIYNYFLSKEEIFATLQGIGLELMARAVLAPASNDPLPDFLAIFRKYYEFSKAQPEYFSLLYVDPSAPQVTTDSPGLLHMMEETFRRFSRCVEHGVFPPGTTENAPGLFWALVHGLAVLRRVQAVPAIDTEPQVEAGLRLLVESIRAGFLPPDSLGPVPMAPGAQTR